MSSFKALQVSETAAGGFERRIVQRELSELPAGDAQDMHIRHGLRGDAFEDTLGQRLCVLEQAVDPRVVVGVEREGRGVDAAAAGRVGDHRARWAVAGRAALVEVEPFFEGSDERADAFLARLFLGR